MEGAKSSAAAAPTTGSGKATATALVAHELARLKEYVRLVNKQSSGAFEMELYDPELANRIFRVSADGLQLLRRGQGGLGDCQAATRTFLSKTLTDDQVRNHDWRIYGALIQPVRNDTPMFHIMCIRGNAAISLQSGPKEGAIV